MPKTTTPAEYGFVSVDPLADLYVRVDTVSLNQARVYEGDMFAVGVYVGNRGQGRSGPSRLDFYLSTDTTITPSDYKLGETAVEPLPAGALGYKQELRILFPSTKRIPEATTIWASFVMQQVKSKKATKIIPSTPLRGSCKHTTPIADLRVIMSTKRFLESTRLWVAASPKLSTCFPQQASV